jgi:3'5'-cyclic nucleotide phosphodiesterase
MAGLLEISHRVWLVLCSVVA